MEQQMEEALEGIYQKTVEHGDNIITVLQEIQNVFGYVQEESVHWFSARTNIPASKFYGVITFYSQFHLAPRGKNIITVCSGTVCHVKGASRIISRIREDLKLSEDVATTKDKLFTLETVNCVGACSIAPVVLVNNKVYGKMNPEKTSKTLKTYKE